MMRLWADSRLGRWAASVWLGVGRINSVTG